MASNELPTLPMVALTTRFALLIVYILMVFVLIYCVFSIGIFLLIPRIVSVNDNGHTLFLVDTICAALLRQRDLFSHNSWILVAT